MNKLPVLCPICGGELSVTRIHCRECDSTIEGRFAVRLIFQLTPEQLEFIEIFLRCEGKISRMEDELKLSYPTIRNRLHEIIRALGYEPGGEEPPAVLSGEARQKILEDLDSGQISVEKAMNLLQERGG